jgi:hypothetical protein
VIFLVEGNGHLGPSKLRRGGEGVNGVHLLVGDVALLVGFISLGAPKDHEAALGLGELIVFLLGTVRRVTSLWGKLLGLALLAEGATDVNLHGRVVLEEMLWLPPVEGQGASSAFSKCSVCAPHPRG